MRRAVEEDNDDIIPLIDMYSPTVKEFYGDYYIAEILTRFQDSGRQIIVAEYNEKVVGVMCLNETVNYEMINDNFEVVPYHGLRKEHEDDEVDIEIAVLKDDA